MTINGSKLIEDSSDVVKMLLLKVYDQAFKDCSITIKDNIVSNFNNLEKLDEILLCIDDTIENTDNSAQALIANTTSWDELNEFRMNLAKQADPFITEE